MVAARNASRDGWNAHRLSVLKSIEALEDEIASTEARLGARIVRIEEKTERAAPVLADLKARISVGGALAGAIAGALLSAIISYLMKGHAQ